MYFGLDHITNNGLSGAAVSTHPVPAVATGEAIGALLESVGTKPDLLIVFASVRHTGALEDVVRALLVTLEPECLIGCTAPTVFANSTDSGKGTGLAAWASRFEPQFGSSIAASWQPTWTSDDPHQLALVDSFDDFFLARDAGKRSVHMPLVGAAVSAGTSPGGNRLIVNDRIENSGAVLINFASLPVATMHSHGARAIGERHTVTAAENRVLRGLAFGDPNRHLMQALSELNDYEHDKRAEILVGVVSTNQGILLDVPLRTTKVLGADRLTGALALADNVSVGDVIQFFVRTPQSAQQDLNDRLIDAVSPAPVSACVAFTDARRSESYFGEPHQDSGKVFELCGAPSIGMTSAVPFGRSPDGLLARTHASALLFS